MHRPIKWVLLVKRDDTNMDTWLHPSSALLKEHSSEAIFIPESYIGADVVISAYMPIGTGKTVEETLAKLNGTYDFSNEEYAHIQQNLVQFRRWKQQYGEHANF